ncbi:MAG TPA: ribosome assembly RNA-binding protein YhbY, partial [Peptococcaceae bacterium]|nr:ribosome assembly RNA-binding protein YhbY [Peptococcaceae bacterium]
MMTGKQKKYLRSLAAKMTPSLQVGKSGISDNVVLQLEEALTARELTK